MSMEKIREIIDGKGQAPDKLIRIKQVVDQAARSSSSRPAESTTAPDKKRRGPFGRKSS